MEEYVGGQEASKILGVHQRTLYQWDKRKLIETTHKKSMIFYVLLRQKRKIFNFSFLSKQLGLLEERDYIM